MEAFVKTAEKWDVDVSGKRKLFNIDLRAVWKYRDLMVLLVRRDFVAGFKQTVLGPVWFLIQPMLTACIYMIIFSFIARIGTNGVPPILFYFSGITLWAYFADCLTKTSNTFISNAALFGKVYFPRLVIPFSMVISNLVKFSLQFTLLVAIWLYYLITTDKLQPHYELMWLIPLLVILMAGLGLGFGLIISSLTTKYRDLTYLVGFGVQLLMYASLVIYPISIIPEQYHQYIMLNPLASVMEAFKYVLLGKGTMHWMYLGYSFVFMIVTLFIALSSFGRVEKSFMDTV